MANLTDDTQGMLNQLLTLETPPRFKHRFDDWRCE
jgi:hypothetical protein